MDLKLGGEAAHDQIERRAQEAFALEELRAGRIPEVQLRKCGEPVLFEWGGSVVDAGSVPGEWGPSDPGSWNRYPYVLNDTVSLNDTRGLVAHISLAIRKQCL